MLKVRELKRQIKLLTQPKNEDQEDKTAPFMQKHQEARRVYRPEKDILRNFMQFKRDMEAEKGAKPNVHKVQKKNSNKPNEKVGETKALNAGNMARLNDSGGSDSLNHDTCLVGMDKADNNAPKEKKTPEQNIDKF